MVCVGVRCDVCGCGVHRCQVRCGDEVLGGYSSWCS